MFSDCKIYEILLQANLLVLNTCYAENVLLYIAHGLVFYSSLGLFVLVLDIEENSPLFL